MAFCKDNAIKYLCRAGKKDVDIQEWRKAAWYIQQGIQYLQELNSGTAEKSSIKKQILNEGE